MSIKPALNQMILLVSSCQTFFKIDSQLGMDLPQPCLCPVHFFVMSTVARYSILNRLSSVGNTVFAFVTFLSCRLKPSIALVVWISRLTPPSGYLKQVERVAQLSCQDLYIFGYLESHFSPNSSSSCKAVPSVGAAYTSFKSAIRFLMSL